MNLCVAWIQLQKVIKVQIVRTLIPLVLQICLVYSDPLSEICYSMLAQHSTCRLKDTQWMGLN